MSRVVRLEHFERAVPMNAYRTLHFRARAAVDRSWRAVFAQLALTIRPRARFVVVKVTAEQVCRRGTTLPDIGACFPVVKAAIDGLVDAGVIPDDTPKHLVSLEFAAPVHGDRDVLALVIEELAP